MEDDWTYAGPAGGAGAGPEGTAGGDGAGYAPRPAREVRESVVTRALRIAACVLAAGILFGLAASLLLVAS